MPNPRENKSKEEEPSLELKDPQYYVNRELGLLEFQRRVLQEAQDESNPLLERVKFLAILGSNLDEFFMVRVAGLKKQVDAGVIDRPPDGLTPAEQLAAIRKVASQLMAEARECMREQLMPQFNDAGIHLLNYDELDDRQQVVVKKYFDEVIFPVLTPLAFDPGHPFPHISNLSLNLAVRICDEHNEEHFARVKVPNTLPRFLPIKRSSGSVRKDGTVPYHHYFTWMERVIAANLDALFPGMEVLDAHPFRVTRDADMEIQELEASDLLETIEENVRMRRFGSVVRVTVNEDMPKHSIDRYDLKESPFKPAVPAVFDSELTDGNIFATIRRQDYLLHHPYESFLPVVDFLMAAAKDPDVLAIKQTLYRVGGNPPVVKALLKAVENGKQVAVLVELKARFDEESNIGWARILERAGVHVVYGLLGLKTHSKIALVVRKEGDGIRRYMHLGTVLTAMTLRRVLSNRLFRQCLTAN